MSSMVASTKGTQYHVRVLDRALDILEILCTQNRALTLTELSKLLGVHKSTLHRLLTVLEERRFVQKGTENGKYNLGLKLFELGSRAVAQLDLRERARPYLERLVFMTGETAHLCILDKGEVLYLEKVESPRTMRVPSIVGQRYPAHCGSAGKTLLAHLSQDQLDEIIKKRGMQAYTRKTITMATQLLDELQKIRRQGFAVDDEEFEEGLRCIGAPVKDYSGKVIASISIAGPTFRVTTEQVAVLARSVSEAADQLSAELGYRKEAHD
jgi:DNA-binding IclR family transcriptional regulator